MIGVFRALLALLPGGIVLVAASAFLVWAPESLVRDFASTYGLAVFGAGLALAWVFHRSRAFILLGLLAWLSVTMVGEPDPKSMVVALGTVILAILVPLCVMRDRGVGSEVGVLQLLGASVSAAVASIYFSDPGRVERFVTRPEMLPIDSPLWPYPRLTLIVVGVAFLSVAYGFHRYRGPVERSLVWSLVLMMVAMHPDLGPDGSSLFLVAIGLTVTLGVVETSYVMAYRDDLTGLPGRRALMQYLDGIQGTYTVAMVDVDHFKKFNDKYGHDVGDQVLKMVASRLGRTKGGGKAYRYGGEEFTLLFPGRTVDQAMEHLEQVRESIAGARFSLRSWKRPRAKPEAEDGKAGDKKKKKGSKKRDPKHLTVTVSLGAADSESTNGDSAALLKAADEALYRAKKAGRNRIAS